MTAASHPVSLDAPAGRERSLVVGAALLTVALWASAFVGIRSAGRELSPGSLALMRLLVGSAALGALMVARGKSLPSRRSLPGIAVCGLLWFGAYNVLLNEAERRVDAGTAAMLVNIGPVLIALLAAALLHEGLPRQLVAGCLVSFAGVGVIAVAQSGGPALNWGAGLCVAAAAVYAGGVVAQKTALRHASALQVTWAACLIGAVACLPFAPSLAGDLGKAHGSAIGWSVYLGIGPTAVGFAAWAYALSRTTAGRMGSSTYLVPPLAILFGWALLGETPRALALPGGVVCLVGVGLTRMRAATPR